MIDVVAGSVAGWLARSIAHPPSSTNPFRREIAAIFPPSTSYAAVVAVHATYHRPTLFLLQKRPYATRGYVYLMYKHLRDSKVYICPPKTCTHTYVVSIGGFHLQTSLRLLYVRM